MLDSLFLLPSYFCLRLFVYAVFTVAKLTKKQQQLKLERLRAEIQKGLEGGESTPLDIQALKREARRRYDERHTR